MDKLEQRLKDYYKYHEIFGREPLLQGLHFPDDASAFQMMGFPVHRKA